VNPLRSLFPAGASTMAGEVDSLFYFLCALSFAVSLLLAGLLFFFAVRYRARGEKRERMRGAGVDEADVKRIEYLWIGGPLVVFLVIFYWGAKLFAAMATPPPDAMQVFVVGKQWMWKAQHLGGRREINELHVPVGRAVKLTMTSEDVIHSFYVPAFRVKTDVLPGRYTTMWFQPTKAGEYHLFCAEYCGTKHSGMIGKVIVMEPRDFQAWLSQAGQGSLAESGERLFGELGCNTCHKEDGEGRGPRVRGVFGTTVQLQNGETVVADESYLRESILEPQKRVVAGFQPVMPSYVTQIDEEKVIQLIAYIRSLQATQKPAAPPPAPVPSAAPSDEPEEKKP
jgi:cytochrome c oxidase subunit II